tara:strand:+ start:813 stop:1034 length:222 start_codon:yes stop_codon:yes gene_type:complete
MGKPTTQFKLSINDVEIIEKALKAKAGRRGMRIMKGESDKQLHSEMHEIQDLLGRLHEQKVWYRPSDKVYVSG